METYNFAPVSAVDVTLYIGDQIVGGARNVDARVTRAKRLVATMGSANFRAIARGERLVTGTLTGVVLYAQNLKDALIKAAATDGAHPQVFKLLAALGWDVQNRLDHTNVSETPVPIAQREVVYLDELPPIDITIVGVSESGETYIQRIYGAEIITHGYSVDLNLDVAVFETVEFAAHHMETGQIGRL